MKHEKQSEIKNWLDDRKKEKLANKITYILLTIIALYFTAHIIYYFVEIKPNAEIPTIDGVPMRNEAQMFNGYNQ